MAARGFWTRAIGRTKRWTGFGVGRSDCRKRAADFSRTARNPRRPVDHYAPELRPISAKSAKRRPKASMGGRDRRCGNTQRTQCWLEDAPELATRPRVRRKIRGDQHRGANLRAECWGDVEPIATSPGNQDPIAWRKRRRRPSAVPPVESRWAAQEIGAAESRGSESGRIRVPLRREPAIGLAFPGAVREPAGFRPAPTCRVGQRLPGSQFSYLTN